MLRASMMSVLCLVAVFQTEQSVWAQSPSGAKFDVESDYQFKVASILPEQVINGPNYEIEPTAKLHEGKFVFRIRTRWGILTAKGLPFLELRLREMYAIERAEQLSDQPQVVHGFLDTLVDAKAGAQVLLTEPVGAVLRIPGGIRNTLTSVLHPGNQRAGSDVRRHLAAAIGCDPETTNPILKKLLDWMSLRKGLGQFAGKIGLNLTLPGLAMLPTTKQFREIVAKELPSDINKRIEKSLLAMGLSKDTAKQFCRGHSFTTTQRLMILTELQALQDKVGSLDVLLERAVHTKNESEGIAFIRELALVHALSDRRSLDAVVSGDHGSAIVVNLEQTGHAVVTADDYWMLTERLSGFCSAYRKSYASTSAVYFGDARLNDRAESYLRRVGIAVPSREPDAEE